MVGIQGLGGVPDPKPDRPAKVRNERDQAATAGTARAAAGGQSKSDGISISSEAQAAAEVSKLVKESAGISEVRMDRVEAARAAIERGDFQNREIVSKVAEKLLKYLG